MSMTKKHFIALASAFHASKPGKTDLKRYTQWMLDRDAVSDVCKQCNPSFNAEMFKNWCANEPISPMRVAGTIDAKPVIIKPKWKA